MSGAAVAALSQGSSTSAVIAWAAAALREKCPPGLTLVDVGCGRGDLEAALGGWFQHCIALDAVAYPYTKPAAWEFHEVDLNAPRFPVADAAGDAVAAVETIEHLENPRALLREMHRICRPGGWILVTTPNQLSWLSKLSLLVKDEFTAFQQAPGLYPTHITALLPVDLLRIARECGFEQAELRYSATGRIPGTARSWPGWMPRRRPQSMSDNVMLLAQRVQP